MPIFDANSISSFYLRPADGLVKDGEFWDFCRGGINWNGVCYRVFGSLLCSIDENNVVTQIGDVGNDYKAVTLDYGFDRLAINSCGFLHYYDGTTLSHVTDPQWTGTTSMKWVDGYYMGTDGSSLYVTDLNNPYTVQAIKYGSSEADPDPITALLKLKNEIVALNRYTIEFFDNVGDVTGLFPFARIEGAQIQRGCVGTLACAIFMEAVAFMGSGKNEPPSIWIGVNGSSSKLATNEIDGILKDYTEAQLAQTVFETRVDEAQGLLYVHLVDQTLVYDSAASAIAKEPVWFVLRSSLEGKGIYRARFLVWCYNKWLVADPSSSCFGHLDRSLSTHYGEMVGWEFATGIGFNGGKGAIINSMELICLPGRNIKGTPKISTQYSLDGETWSQEKFISSGVNGNRLKRLLWLRQGMFRNWRVQKFKGTSDSFMTFARLEMDVEPLNV